MVFCQQYLKDTSHAVKSKCLELIGALLPVGDESHNAFVLSILRLIGDYTHSQDARVRAAAFKTMVREKFPIVKKFMCAPASY